MSGRPCSPKRGPSEWLARSAGTGWPLLGTAGEIIIRVLLGRDRTAFEEVKGFIQHAGVRGGQHVAACRQRQPEVIIRTVRAHAPARGRMPPVLDIALKELTACAQQQLRTQPLRLRMHERHRVLQLIAEAECASRLVVSAARP